MRSEELLTAILDAQPDEAKTIFKSILSDKIMSKIDDWRDGTPEESDNSE